MLYQLTFHPSPVLFSYSEIPDLSNDSETDIIEVEEDGHMKHGCHSPQNSLGLCHINIPQNLLLKKMYS